MIGVVNTLIMSLLSDWLNGDNWALIRDKYNDGVTKINKLGGGTTGQIPTKNSGNDFDFTWTTPTASIPTLVANKFLSNNATILEWVSIPFDRQMDSGAPNASYPTSGTSTVISTLTGAAGVNRDYKLEFTWAYNQISTAPEMHMSFYRNGVLLVDYHHVAITVNGQSQVSTIHYMDLNIPAGAVYTVVISVTGSSNQYNLQNWVFSLDGTPSA